MTETPEQPQRQLPQPWPLRRMIAFSASTITVVCILIFVVSGVVVNTVQPDLGQESMLFPLLGAVLVAGSGVALIGLIAGLVDLVESSDRRGVTVLAVVLNGLVAVFVFSMVVIGLVS